MITENLIHKYWMHEEAEQEIKYIWEIHYYLQIMFMIVKINADDFFKFSEEFFNITEIVLNNKWKQFKIKSLKKTVKEIKEKKSCLISVTEVQTVGTEDCYLCTFEEKDGVIARLEAWLCSENLGSNLYANSNHDLIEDF